MYLEKREVYSPNPQVRNTIHWILHDPEINVYFHFGAIDRELEEIDNFLSYYPDEMKYCIESDDGDSWAIHLPHLEKNGDCFLLVYSTCEGIELNFSHAYGVWYHCLYQDKGPDYERFVEKFREQIANP